MDHVHPAKKSKQSYPLLIHSFTLYWTFVHHVERRGREQKKEEEVRGSSSISLFQFLSLSLSRTWYIPTRAVWSTTAHQGIEYKSQLICDRNNVTRSIPLIQYPLSPSSTLFVLILPPALVPQNSVTWVHSYYCYYCFCTLLYPPAFLFRPLISSLISIPHFLPLLTNNTL